MDDGKQEEEPDAETCGKRRRGAEEGLGLLFLVWS